MNNRPEDRSSSSYVRTWVASFTVDKHLFRWASHKAEDTMPKQYVTITLADAQRMISAA